MKTAISLTLLLILTTSLTNFRLNTKETTRLNVGDSLISTLGYFKATLLQNQCVLSVQKFNGNNGYTKLGNYTSPDYNGNCNALVISEGKVATDNNFNYLTVGTSFNISTILTIDDWGVIRLIGTYQLPDFRNQESLEITINQFLQTNQSYQTYVYTASQAEQGFNLKLGPIVNKRSWEYSTFFGQLDILHINNPGLSVSYSYSYFKLNNSLIYDFPKNTFPSTIFPNMTFGPRCFEPRIFLDFKTPYTIVLDQFWPRATVYEQGRYKIGEISYGSVYQPQAWQLNRRLYFRNQFSVCPPFTFDFKGNCVTSCPPPYYHELRGVFGYCVLTCEEFTPKDDVTRVCSCFTDYEAITISSENITACPADAIRYPYGCYCNSTTLYFDRTLSLSCVATCPQGTFADQSLCMECPNRCINCQIDKLYRSYLECLACESGYNLVKGQCYKTCSPGLGNSLVNGLCQSCADPNCLDCSTNVATCLRCNLLYAVSNGACLQICNNGTQIAFFETLNSICLPVDQTCSGAFSTYYKNQSMLKCFSCLTNTYLHGGKCLTQCPTNFAPNANNYCVCSQNGTLTVNDQCLAIPICPIQMGWDSVASSCVSCEFGCLTCFDIECTSCNPGYFLYVSPQGAFCRRKGPLYACDGQYAWINGICLLIQFSNPTFTLTKCLHLVTNCQACFRNSETICASCKPGFYNVNNTCITTCPQGTIPFENVTCILPEVQNCAQPYLELPYQAVVVNYNLVQNSDPYYFLTFLGKAAQNDPVGYIPVFQQLITRKNDGLFRNTDFYNPRWTCLKCADGMGLSPDFSQCSPCPPICATCYMARNDSCITVSNVACPDYVDYMTGVCIKNCSAATYRPYVQNNILYCYPEALAPSNNLATIDSSTYKNKDGSTTVFFVMDSSQKSGSSVTVPIMKETSFQRVAASGGSMRVGANVQNAQVNNGYLFLQDTNPNNQLWIMNATGNLQKLAQSSNIALSNSVYGVSSSQGHNVFMKSWLAYIGYIMGPVLIVLHAVFIGNDLMYKVDNTLILAQALYFVSFVQLLVGKLLSQFYYGWLFAMFGFFPNFFGNTVPANYVELAAPNSYKLSTMDANLIRNAGWAFSLFLVFLGAWGIITFFCWLLKAACNKNEAWYPKLAVNSLIAGGQFLSFPVFYWSIANIMYIGNSFDLSPSFYDTSKIVSIVFATAICLYGTLRWFFNPLGGLYMYKRIIIATILAATHLDNRMLAALLCTEAVFCLVRYIIESPEQYKFIWIMLGQCLLHIVVYLMCFLSLDAGTNTILISIIIFVMIVVLAYGLTEVYLESQNEWEVEDKVDDEDENEIVAAERKQDDRADRGNRNDREDRGNRDEMDNRDERGDREAD